uniref:Uncharacterized protein n=1 Tax=Grammatophora oceanica TaxID=210454 RepID=A0A7S1VM27_9STRA|mmetsp:Transcript_48388/g.72174  ORF Transcript_48388/g.72174 Transcript_48388/m.72174 type:complete len:277 (+) Transcript_48388:70-900(+)|eukprot:CAMPEP_0194032282 /NCGR_PEP_ID=MMETSP0009_2-20130614/5264_1 /TAXON_ID=210454 /ORGANISM="Grammatophora oceanica, Strain CCMP 410" /LENGTH=276 /DNA_ID=CAMNT_0038672675 /DNA_START=66 /DNA_END=896 /DNA_ORIENTATION=-
MAFVGCCKVKDYSYFLGTLTCLAALILSLFAVNHCDFLVVKLHDSTMDLPPLLSRLFPGIEDGLSLGINTREDLSFGDEWNCRRWNTNDAEFWWDATYQGAMSMGILANIFGIAVAILGLNSMCFDFDGTLKYMTVCLCVLVGICQGLVFIIFATDKCNDGVFECQFSSAAGINVAATTLWFIAACCFMKGGAAVSSDEEYEAAEEEAEKEAADGEEGDAEKEEEAEAPQEQPLDEEAGGEEPAAAASEGEKEEEEDAKEEDDKPKAKKKGFFGLW